MNSETANRIRAIFESSLDEVLRIASETGCVASTSARAGKTWSEMCSDGKSIQFLPDAAVTHELLYYAHAIAQDDHLMDNPTVYIGEEALGQLLNRGPLKNIRVQPEVAPMRFVKLNEKNEPEIIMAMTPEWEAAPFEILTIADERAAMAIAFKRVKSLTEIAITRKIST